jgi:uncharacterized protein
MEARLREGIALFNGKKFFDAHEVWEELYHDTADENKAFLEGLIGLAAAFRLFQDFHEIKGPVRMIYQSLIRLENYQPAFLEIDVTALCQAAEAWAKTSEAANVAPASSSLPKIKMQGFRFFS